MLGHTRVLKRCCDRGRRLPCRNGLIEPDVQFAVQDVGQRQRNNDCRSGGRELLERTGDTHRPERRCRVSLKAMSAAFERSAAKGSARSVLVALANYVNDGDGYAWPSVDTLAHRTGLSPRTVRRCLHDLVASGELVEVPEGSSLPKRVYTAYNRIK